MMSKYFHRGLAPLLTGSVIGFATADIIKYGTTNIWWWAYIMLFALLWNLCMWSDDIERSSNE